MFKSYFIAYQWIIFRFQNTVILECRGACPGNRIILYGGVGHVVELCLIDLQLVTCPILRGYRLSIMQMSQ